LYLAGALSFTEGTPQGSVIWLYAVGYGFYFVLGALLEEFSCRGYLLFTLTTGVGFWPAAVLSSILFGLLHTRNPGETAIGCFSTGVFGLLFCLMLRRSGNLWMPIGFHAAYNWGEAFFYGTPDSGLLSPERFLTAKLSGPNWLTGGSAGPEGSYLCLAILALVAIGFGIWQRDVKYPNPAALRKTLPAPAPVSLPDSRGELLQDRQTCPRTALSGHARQDMATKHVAMAPRMNIQRRVPLGATGGGFGPPVLPRSDRRRPLAVATAG
jgi:hypothetical protein